MRVLNCEVPFPAAPMARSVSALSVWLRRYAAGHVLRLRVDVVRALSPPHPSAWSGYGEEEDYETLRNTPRQRAAAELAASLPALNSQGQLQAVDLGLNASFYLANLTAAAALSSLRRLHFGSMHKVFLLDSVRWPAGLVELKLTGHEGIHGVDGAHLPHSLQRLTLNGRGNLWTQVRAVDGSVACPRLQAPPAWSPAAVHAPPLLRRSHACASCAAWCSRLTAPASTTGGGRASF